VSSYDNEGVGRRIERGQGAEASAGLSRSVSGLRVEAGGGRAMNASSNLTMRHQWRQHTNTNGITPGPRSGAASVIVGNKLYVFGGYGGNGRLADFFEFDFETKEFQEIEVQGSANPGVRENNGVVLYKNRLYIFGGYNGSDWLNDFHEFDLTTKVWRKIEPEGDCPSPRFGYVAVRHADSFIIFGGYDGTTWLNDMHEHNFLSKQWCPIHPSGTIPSVRSCPSWTVHNSSVFIFGGYDGVQRMNDFFEYRCDTRVWSTVLGSGPVPSPRYFHACIMYRNQMYIFGGYNGAHRLNDMYCFDFDTHMWAIVDCSGELPSGRSSLVAQVYGNSLFTFGGYNGRHVLNDFFEFRFEPVAIPPPTLIHDMKRLMNCEEFSDVTFLVEGKPVYATRAHLAVRSEHFRAMLFGGMRESHNGATTEIIIRDVTHSVFSKIIEFLYTDNVTDISSDIAVPLLMAAERYLLGRLKGLCEDSIRKSITVENVINLFMASHRHRAAGLKEICLDFIIDHLDTVKKSKGFRDLKDEPELLMEIIMVGT
jgi:N-acetylneuraminic acid mutarotase